MGSSKSKVDCAVWIPSKTDPLLVKDQDGREGEISSYSLNSIYDPALEKAIYEARNIAAEPIVKAYSANYETKGPALHPNTEFKVVTQRIPNRLSDSPQLMYPQSLYVLSQALAGYQTLHKQCGDFSVNANMIGFNNNGEVKVWHNSNFAKNHPESIIPNIHVTAHQQDYANLSLHKEARLVKNIYSLVEEKNQEGIFPESLSSQFKNREIGLEKARTIVGNEIAAQPYRVDSINTLNRSVKVKKSALKTVVQPPIITSNVVQTVPAQVMETVNNYVVNSPPLIPISTTHVEVLKPAPSIRISGQVQPSSTTYLATSNAYPVQKVEVKQVVPTIATSIVQPRQSFLRFNYIDPKLAQYQY